MSNLEPPAAIVDAAWRDGRLAFQRTADGAPVWPPRMAEPGSGARLTWHESAGLGTVYAATSLHTRDGDTRSVVLVDLDEGPRMMSRVEGLPPQEVHPGMRVQVAFTDSDPDTGARLPVFRPLEADA